MKDFISAHTEKGKTMATKKCGDCIHADICKQVNGGWFSRDNPAYCKGFKDQENYVEVIRCNDCKQWGGVVYGGRCKQWSAPLSGITYFTCADDFCSYGERRTDV